MSLRHLSNDEITRLESQGCWAEDWRQVHVSADFSPHRVQNSRFFGTVELGRFSADVELEPDILRPSGIYESTLQDCSIGDDVRIAAVGELVRYRVEDGVVLQQIGKLTVIGQTTFGNGTALDVVNEGGGRSLLIFDRLSAQLAYCLVHYRHDAELIQRLEAMIREYCAAKRSARGIIGCNARIEGCAVLENLVVGPYAEIRGAAELCDGTLASNEADPVRIGAGVVARNFIVQSGSHIGDGVLLYHCFLGQGVRLGKQFSAEHSAFFANCEGFHGEAVSVLAGPYTVTHHKSTLLIAAHFSFFNAGSNSNQSNHMYKLGPLHQGLFERGSKSGSGSYLLWPCRIGAFTVVMGKHTANFDSSDLPFSYIDVQDGKSFITPAMNLFTVGTKRDSAKWPSRDRRRDLDKRDRIHFDLFNPFVLGRVLRGMDLLDKLAETTPSEQEVVKHKGLYIKRLLLKTCRKFYEIAVQVSIGQMLVDKLEASHTLSWFALKRELATESAIGKGEWIDVCGLLVPKVKMEELLCEIRSGAIPDLEQLDSRFDAWYNGCSIDCWAWLVGLIEKRLERTWDQIEIQHLEKLVQEWRDQGIKLNNLILHDAEKEFDVDSRIGYGIDGDGEIADGDFTAVRGSLAENSFICQLQEENRKIIERAESLLKRLQSLSQ